MAKSESYKMAECCHVDCNYLDDNPDEPCWGEVVVVGEDCNEDYSDCYWIHACKGHAEICDWGKYINENS